MATDAEVATKTDDENEVKLAKVILNGKRIAESWLPRQDQADGISKLRKRLDDDVERFDNSVFDILGDAAMKRLAPILIKLSGKKKYKRNRMSVLSVMHQKYKEQLKDDPEMKRIYKLLAKAGIYNAFLNLYGQDGVFDYHRDQFLSLSSNCMPPSDALKYKNRRYCHKAAPGKILFEACNDHEFMCELITKCYGMGLEGRGVTMVVRHKAERGADVEGWDLTLVIGCTKEQHERLQELIGHQLAEDRLMNRPDLGKGVESGACWDLGVYMSEISNKLVDDGSGNGTTMRACVKGGNTLVDDGSGNGTMVRPCNKQESCITCNVARRIIRGSDQCGPCALAAMAAFFGK